MNTNISLFDDSLFENIVCFVDTPFAQKTARRGGIPECCMLPCISVILSRALTWLGADARSLQVWILVGTRDTQIAHCEGPACFLSQCKSEQYGHIFPTTVPCSFTLFLPNTPVMLNT